ncbi:MAG: pentapeptide repeat-containing protein [Oscillatoriaceae bacterium SKW80]|nr:pentapeptide repeat-containing protein [Oscillatoriaceae bacterium SKYG93]MCX8120346.1 pentapeptide repeat-containing protein [Oscillatoriaceae bacterium SKW80]MDW8453272.1 pentapeptide repeat-containing protein [Oscillatoriaceae cyanobacterium SKYGB_i_bin93]HIK27285.1 pentapeptide repeat-containing protein [Oscillatoriaceae cyanobacterium M7585_C2015_266]
METEELIKKYAAGVRDFTAVNLCEANLSRVNLSGANLSQANLSIANLGGANLSQANLSHAKLNVAKLNGANLSQANLSGADLNVANLIRADLSDAELTQAALIRAELIRVELSRANLSEANLNGASLREAKLRQANLAGANLSEADLRNASLRGANLERATLRETDLRGADLTGANLRNAELRRANLSQAKLVAADLSGANLRWADLSGSTLRWADLSETKLSGANLRGADLSGANMINTSLVYSDLTQSNLIEVDWMGADLSGATLTGAKLHAVLRFGLKTEGLTCEWVDLSPNGDRSQIYRLTPEESKKFFNQTLPTVRIIVDATLNPDAHLALAVAYHQIAHRCSTGMSHPPNIEVIGRRTILTFRVGSDTRLFSTAYVAILPFQDAAIAQEKIVHLVQMIESPEVANILNQTLEKIDEIKKSETFSKLVKREKFFQSPTLTVLTNSGNRTLDLHHNKSFGKRMLTEEEFGDLLLPISANDETQQIALPPASVILSFIKGLNLNSNTNK